MKFEWDDKKAEINLEKHGVSFEDAVEIFKDKNLTTLTDTRFDYGEIRLVSFGRITLTESKRRLVAVVYVEKISNELTRIISARKANKREVKTWQQLQKQ